MDLDAVFGEKNKNKKVVAKKTIVVTKEYENRVKNNVKLLLCDGVEFSMTLFDKVNKGFVNISKVNCFMNVCLQSLFACPAFFNMLQQIALNETLSAILQPDGLLKKLVYTSRFFDGANQLDTTSQFAKSTVNAEKIFEPFLDAYNPDNEQQDACDFLSYLLDQCHEELKSIYVPQRLSSQQIQQRKQQDGDWSEVGGLKATSVQENKEQILEPSIVRDIFGGVLRTELHV